MKVNDTKVFEHFDIASETGNCFPVAMGIFTDTDPADHMNLKDLKVAQVYNHLKGMGLSRLDDTDKGFIIWFHGNAHIAAIIDGEIQDFSPRSTSAQPIIIMGEKRAKAKGLKRWLRWAARQGNGER